MKKQKNINKFPKDFLWGVAYSSHQVEGNNQNDWIKKELK
jgi:beta-glucosidase/6-phospho-beta-glucosidase/beta-galactosidase